jgi:bacillaene synthase trans-acting acyltransferase
VVSDSDITAEQGEFLNEPSGKHLWDVTRNPVDLAKAIRQLEASGTNFYVDLGPSGSLATAVKVHSPQKVSV